MRLEKEKSRPEILKIFESGISESFLVSRENLEKMHGQIPRTNPPPSPSPTMEKDGINPSFKSLARNLSEAVVMTDAMGRITWTNDAFHQLCGYSPEEVLGRIPGHMLQGERTDPSTAQNLSNAVRQGQGIRAEVINYHKDGSPYWVSISITPIKTNRGKLQGFVAFERETTEQHETLDLLEEQIGQLYQALLISEGQG